MSTQPCHIVPLSTFELDSSKSTTHRHIGTQQRGWERDDLMDSSSPPCLFTYNTLTSRGGNGHEGEIDECSRVNITQQFMVSKYIFRYKRVLKSWF